MKKDSGFTTIILAGGSSSRLGTSKQLLTINGQPLLVRTTATVVESDTSRTIVVLGADSSQHERVLRGISAETVINKDWRSGIGSSIKCGVSYALQADPDLKATIICVCDQPMLTVNHLNSLMNSYNSPSDIVASFYDGTDGVPALFGSFYFKNLLSLDDSRGAKQLFQQHGDKLKRIEFKNGSVDIDTHEDYVRFLQKTGVSIP